MFESRIRKLAESFGLLLQSHCHIQSLLLIRHRHEETMLNELTVFSIDQHWEERLFFQNSVMDDNKLLTLANGERIRLQDSSALLFEVADLKYASPATVSRCGMVYIDSNNLGPETVWQRWLRNQQVVGQKNVEFVLNVLYERYVPSLLNLIFYGQIGVERRGRMKMIVSRLVNKKESN